MSFEQEINYKQIFLTQPPIDRVSHLAPKIWSQIPTEIKNCKTLHMFKNLIKTWAPKFCPCRHCKEYIFNVGYI